MVPLHKWRLGCALAMVGVTGSMMALGCGRSDSRPLGPFTTEEPPAAESVGDEAEILAVNWLTAHQSADGGWAAAGFHQWQMGERVAAGEAVGPGVAHNDVAVTALATLRHLLAGYGPRHPGHFGAAVAWGLHALCARQRADGCLSDPSQSLWATNHALAAWALAEAAARDAGDTTVDAARRAFTFLSASLAREDAAWRTERGPADLPPLAWVTRARIAAREADRRLGDGPHRRPALVAEEGPMERARADVAGWVVARPEERTLGRVGAGLLARAVTDPQWKSAPDVAAALAWLDAHGPVWELTGAGVDLAGCYLATVACREAGGEAWNSWERAIRSAVVDHQRMDGGLCLAGGSWDPLGVWGAEGGRVFSTATCGLICLIYYGGSPLREQYATPLLHAPPTTDPLPERRYPKCR
jgi:hypothetical protein